jgi:hypothetical protein
VTAVTALGTATEMRSPIFCRRPLSHPAVTFRHMRALACLCVGIILLLVATAAILVTAVVQVLAALLPLVVCAALVVGIIHALRAPKGSRAVPSRPGRRVLPGAPMPDVTPGYRYTQHVWGWTRTPQGRWAWVSVWIAQPANPADVVDAEVISEEHGRD